MKLSLIIPTFERITFVIESFSQVLNNSSIDEIIIVDDHSDIDTYITLWNLVANMESKKIKLSRNTKNLGPMQNKYVAVKKCKNPWIIVIDSDNIIDNTYITHIETLEKKVNTLYCPEILLEVNKKVNFSYKEFCGLNIDKTNAKFYVQNKNFETWMNTGNYFFNKKTYLKNIEKNIIETELSITDSIYFSYLWLLSGNRMQIVPELYYFHRIHKGSWWQNHSKECVRCTTEIIKKIQAL